jgi:hypothetical protein
LAFLQEPTGFNQAAEWLPEDLAAYLGRANGRGLLGTGASLVDIDGSTEEGMELDGLEAFFAREGTNGGQSRNR